MGLSNPALPFHRHQHGWVHLAYRLVRMKRMQMEKRIPSLWTMYTSNSLVDHYTVDRARYVASIFAAIPAIWAPADLIQLSINCKTYYLRDCHTFTRHQSIFMRPDLEVCSQLGFPMLNDVMQAASKREKPSPDATWHDQTIQMHCKACPGCVI